MSQLELLIESIEKTAVVTKEEVYDAEVLKAEFDNLMTEIGNLPQLDMEEYISIFEDQVIKPLQDETIAENTKIQEAGNICIETMSSYIEEMALLDFYEYYDYEKMDDLIADFGDNIFNLEDKVYQTHEDYLNYVADSINMTNESMGILQEDIEEAYEGTASNVKQEIDLAKQSRQEMNETNIGILNNFSQKLPYTRIGNLEYVQAYDFMVKPIKMSDTSVSKNRKMIFQDYDALRNVLVILIVMFVLFVCGLAYIKFRAESEDNSDKE